MVGLSRRAGAVGRGHNLPWSTGPAHPREGLRPRRTGPRPNEFWDPLVAGHNRPVHRRGPRPPSARSRSESPPDHHGRVRFASLSSRFTTPAPPVARAPRRRTPKHQDAESRASQRCVGGQCQGIKPWPGDRTRPARAQSGARVSAKAIGGAAVPSAFPARVGR